MADAGGLLGARFFQQQQAALDEIELFERQAAAGFFQRLGVAWEMDGRPGRAARHQMVRRDDGGRQDFGKFRKVFQKRAEHRAEKFLVHSIDGRVDGQDGEMRRPALAVFEEFIGMNLVDGQLSASAIRKGGPPRHEDAATRLEFRFEKRLVEPRDLDESRAIADKRREDRHVAAAGFFLRDIRDRAGKCRLLADNQLRDRRLHGLVFVGARDVRQEVVHGHDAESREQLRLLRADALEILYGIGQFHRRFPFLGMNAFRAVRYTAINPPSAQECRGVHTPQA